MTPQGHIRYRLKMSYRDGTAPVVLEPMDFMARLAALVPRPRVNLIRNYGQFAPNSLWWGDHAGRLGRRVAVVRMERPAQGDGRRS
ncbi:MAG: transposase [Pseudomonadota bacterium]|nr:MAG: transposase [Pseudomonadota bacterium]